MNENQYGFRQQHSTSHALNFSVHHIEKRLKNREHVVGIFIDLSKAFDTIDHILLLVKLERYGIRGNTLKLLGSYLTGRYQYTSVLNEISNRLPVLYGVPQGSVLGPLLFLIYINDISNCSNLAKFVLFADDTNIFVTGMSKVDAYIKANTILESIYNYMIANKLHVNTKKCCYIYFRPKISSKKAIDSTVYDNLVLKMHDNILEQVTQTKFLGVIIDEELSWIPHINYKTTKLKCCMGSLNRIKENVPASLHKSLYHTLFESHLTYGITVWGGAPDKYIDQLFTVQKMCMRIMFGDKEAYLDKFKTCSRTRPIEEQLLGAEFYTREHTKPLFSCKSIMTIHNLYIYHTTLAALKIFKFRTPMPLYCCFNLSKRKETLLITPWSSRNFIYQASSIWNTVRSKIDTKDFSVKLGKVKLQLKNLILKRQKLGDQTEWSEDNFRLG